MSLGRTPRTQTPVKGRKFALGFQNEVLSNGLEVTSPAVDATITVGAENTDVRLIEIQLKNAKGQNIDFVEVVDLIVFGDCGGLSFSAGGSTGLAIGTDGALLAVVAKKIFKCTTEATGHADFTWTDTGTAAAFLGVVLPNGRVVVSSAMTNT